jgi:hypothetical protein
VTIPHKRFSALPAAKPWAMGEAIIPIFRCKDKNKN